VTREKRGGMKRGKKVSEKNRPEVLQKSNNPCLASVRLLRASEKISVASFKEYIIRNIDCLFLQATFYNLSLKVDANGQTPILVPTDTHSPSYITFEFPSQSIAEEWVPLSTAGARPPRQWSPAGPTRLAFQLGPELKGISYDLESILDWTSLVQVSPVSEGEPSLIETRIEVPYGVVLSPDSSSVWQHTRRPEPPNPYGTISEPWRAWISSPAGNAYETSKAGGVKLRAVYVTYALPSDFYALKLDDCKELVALTCPPGLQPLQAYRLSLSSLGSSSNIVGNWPETPSSNHQLLGLTYRSAQGRDCFVQKTELFFSFPFCLNVKLVTTYGRAVMPEEHQSTPSAVAYLAAAATVDSLEPSIFDLKSFPNGGAEMIFKQVELVDGPYKVDPVHESGQFWPLRPGTTEKVIFHLTGVDRRDRPIDYYGPLYLYAERSQDADIQRARDTYVAELPRFMCGGAQVAFASSDRDDTSAETRSLTFSLSTKPLSGSTQFVPRLAEAQILLPGVKQLTGKDTVVNCEFFSDFVSAGGFDSGPPGEVFLRLKDGLSFDQRGQFPEGTGGVGNVALAVSGLSRKYGVIAGNPQQISQEIVPKDLFSDAAKLLGNVSLEDILASGPITAELGMPTLVSNTTVDGCESSVSWAVTNRPGYRVLNSVSPLNMQDTSSLKLTAYIGSNLTAGKTTVQISGELCEFELSFSVLSVYFSKMAFKYTSGEKPSLVPSIKGVSLRDPLNFLQTLEDNLAGLISSDFYIDLAPLSISIGTIITIGNLDLGSAFSLDNIRFEWELILPFGGDPLAFRFGFSDRSHPFRLTIDFLSGGGFFALELNALPSQSGNVIRELEAALEFGAYLSLSLLDIASGSVHAMAGVYWHFDGAADQTEFSGFLDLGGDLSVLGFISVSVQLLLSLNVDGSDIEGRADLTISVSVLFFSESWSFSVEQRFSSTRSSAARLNHPLFTDYMSREQWRTYWGAFQ
jgi:hypothetical protein